MTRWESLKLDMEWKRIRIKDYFILVCSHVDLDNVDDICNAVPPEDWLAFRRLVTYQKMEGRFFEMGSNSPTEIDDKFRNGLKILREHLSVEGTLQFGDYLVMEKDSLEKEYMRWENEVDPQTALLAKEIKHQLFLIDELLTFNKTSVLGMTER